MDSFPYSTPFVSFGPQLGCGLLSLDTYGLWVRVARQEEVGAVVVELRPDVGEGVGEGVRRNATPRLRVPGVEAYVQPTWLFTTEL